MFIRLNILVQTFVICLCLPTDRLQAKNKLILILADGVRYDYVADPNLKGFNQLAKHGVRAEYVQPIFPANSYPNWYTIVTAIFFRCSVHKQTHKHF
ncbi:ectonucleotide pyrophosphatase/phosphodiesterase family member 6-like protein [Leptotrombidium deliense]|uniref:glycerophosphocholine cholinephosphodiesterase n=1 Tax=Leptotrombidium deliense TaxID=299467 RepID=A0A443RWM8_9ACAR|nr:ectonucleotide pyrophosphatase/phosphodiesterase family member 6-like protein [Leptotrombidium deliense]